MKKMANIHQILKNVFFTSPRFYEKFQQVAKNIKRFYYFQTLISNIEPNLAKRSSLQLRQKIVKKTLIESILLSICWQVYINFHFPLYKMN
jgi:hypothetical protein